MAKDFVVMIYGNINNSGVRDFEAVNALAAAHGLELLRDIAMPSNNRILMWEKPADACIVA